MEAPPSTIAVPSDAAHADEVPVTEEQVAQVRSLVEQQWASALDDATVRRFVRATGGNLALSAKRLNATCAWRASQKPEDVVCKACATNPRSHYMHVVGHSSNGWPIIYSCIALAENKVYTDNRDHLIQTFEQTVKMMQQGVEQWVWICDFHGFGLSDALNIRIARTFLEVSAAHYPERLGSFLLIDAPAVFSIMWKALESLIDPKTFKKIKFVPYDAASPNSKLQAEMRRLADQDTAGWLLTEMAENRDKLRAKGKTYDMHAIHKAASSGDLAKQAAEGKLSHSASEHDLRGTTQLLGLISAHPSLLEPQALTPAPRK